MDGMYVLVVAALTLVNVVLLAINVKLVTESMKNLLQTRLK